MANPEMGSREPEEETTQQEPQEEYSLEQSKTNLEKILKDWKEGKIDISESIRRQKELIKKMAELRKKGEKDLQGSAERLKKAVDNFNDTINREV